MNKVLFLQLINVRNEFVCIYYLSNWAVDQICWGMHIWSMVEVINAINPREWQACPKLNYHPQLQQLTSRPWLISRGTWLLHIWTWSRLASGPQWRFPRARAPSNHWALGRHGNRLAGKYRSPKSPLSPASRNNLRGGWRCNVFAGTLWSNNTRCCTPGSAAART